MDADILPKVYCNAFGGGGGGGEAGRRGGGDTYLIALYFGYLRKDLYHTVITCTCLGPLSANYKFL